MLRAAERRVATGATLGSRTPPKQAGRMARRGQKPVLCSDAVIVKSE